MPLRFLTRKMETTPLTMVLATFSGLFVLELLRYRIQPRLFGWLVSKGYFGWAELLAGGTLNPHDYLWANRHETADPSPGEG